MDSLPSPLAAREPLPGPRLGAARGGAAGAAGIRRWRVRARAFCAARVPELIVLAFGVLLRVSLAKWYDVTLGYDYPTHHEYVRYLADHHALPAYDLNVATYHPPLYYFLAALIESAGFSPQTVGWLSIACSCLQLGLLWWGLELYLPGGRLPRVLALGTATVVPAAVHVAGMVSNEALNDLFCTGATLLLPQAFLRRGRAAIAYAAAAGGCMGLALMTKISGMMVLLAVVAAVAIAMLHRRRGHQASATTAASEVLKVGAVVLAVAAALGSWPYLRVRAMQGSWIFTGYDQWRARDTMQKIPYLDRRTLGFVLAWDGVMYGQPYWPSASVPRARFWPMLVVTTFSDYYNFAFVPRPGRDDPATRMNGKPMRRSALWPSRLSVVGGTALALLTVLAWLIAARTLWRARDHSRLVILLVGLFAMLGQLHFAVDHPYDGFGPIKGAYLQFAGPIYCGLAALAIAWLWRRWGAIGRVLAGMGMAAILLVGAYTLFARVVVPLGS